MYTRVILSLNGGPGLYMIRLYTTSSANLASVPTICSHLLQLLLSRPYEPDSETSRTTRMEGPAGRQRRFRDWQQRFEDFDDSNIFSLQPCPAPALNASTSACNAAKSAMISLCGSFGCTSVCVPSSICRKLDVSDPKLCPLDLL
jgi:hypothetical protein